MFGFITCDKIYKDERGASPFIDSLLPAERVELLLEADKVAGILGVGYDVVKLIGVALEVVKLVIRQGGVLGVVEVQKLIATVAHTIVTHHVVFCWTVVVVIVEVLAPILGCFTLIGHDR